MKLMVTSLPEVVVLEPEVFDDERGFFYESFNQRRFQKLVGRENDASHFVQDNHSKSAKGVLRGLHYQISRPQAKLVRVIAGEVFDVAVDLRKSSSMFGKWVGMTLSADNRRQLWIPEGFAHGFLVLSDSAEVLYKTTEYWYAEHERCLLWNDGALGIEWQSEELPLLSEKDRRGSSLINAEVFP